MDGAEAQGGYRAYLSDLSSFSQEFRLASNSDNQLQWMVGANFATDELQQTTIFDQPDNLLFPAVGGQVPLQERDLWAVFTHLDYSLNDRWSIFGGLRYTDEERTQEKIGTYLFADPLDIFGGFFAVSPDLANFVPGALLTDHCVITGGVGNCSNNPQPQTDEIGGEEWSGKLGVNFFMSDDTLLYGWIARGTKSGGFNDVAAANSESYIPSEPEFLNAIELGTKTTLLDGTLRINASAFYYDYEDQQVGGQILSRFFGLLGALVNAPESEVKGGEIEVLWSPNDVLTLRQNVGYLNAKFDTHSSLNGAGITAYRDDCIAFTMANCDWVMPDPSAPWYNPNLHVGTNDLSGERFGGPRWSLSGSAELRFAVGSDYELSFYADYNYSEAALSDERAGSRGQFTILNNPAALPSDVPSFLFDSTGDGQGDTRVVRGGYDWVFINGRITLSKGDAWDLALFGRNLADEYRYSFGSFNDGANIIPDEPRTWGVRFRYNFN